jgi:hypothetical protein
MLAGLCSTFNCYVVPRVAVPRRVPLRLVAPRRATYITRATRSTHVIRVT